MHIQRSVTIDALLAQVRAFTADPLNDPAWITDLDSVRWTTDPPAVPGARAEFAPLVIGRLVRLSAELVAVSESAVEWRAETRLLRGLLRYDYATHPGGPTAFTLTFDATLALPLRPLGPLLGPLLGWRVNAYLRTLKRRLEAKPD